jgi:hypothetical protein
MPSFLGLEAPLVQHLENELASAGMAEVRVLSAADLAGVAEGSQHVPAVHVVYGGYRVVGDTTPAWVDIEQTWLTVIAVRNVRANLSGAAARSDAGNLIGVIIDALQRRRIDTEYGPLRLANSPARPAYSAGYFYHPIAWTTTTKWRNPQCASS